MKYRVTGISRITNQQNEIDVRASSAQEASTKAEAFGFQVVRVEALPDDASKTVALVNVDDADAADNTGRAWELRDYTLRLVGEELTVSGPNGGLAALLGRRFLALLESDEGRLALMSEDLRHRLADLFHVPIQSTNELATAAQIRYAAALGFDVSNDTTADEVGFLLTCFEQVRYYVYFVFRAVFGEKPSEFAVSTERINGLVSIIIGDEALVAQIMAIQIRRDATGSEAPRRGEPFRQVNRLVQTMR